VAEDGSSSIIIISGANLLLTPQEVRDSSALLSSSKVLICQLEITDEATLEALKLARSYGGMNALGVIRYCQTGHCFPSYHHGYINNCLRFNHAVVFSPDRPKHCGITVLK